MNGIANSLEECGARPRRGTCMRMPTLVVKPPNEGRQSRAKFDGLFLQQAVVQGVEGRKERRISALPMVLAEPISKSIEPLVGCLYSQGEFRSDRHRRAPSIAAVFGKLRKNIV